MTHPTWKSLGLVKMLHSIHLLHLVSNWNGNTDKWAIKFLPIKNVYDNLEDFIFVKTIFIESFIESSSDSEHDEHKLHSEVEHSSLIVHRTYSYQYTGSKSIRSDQLVKVENGKLGSAALEENSGPTPTIPFVQNPIVLPSSYSHTKTNINSGSSTRQGKKLGVNQNTGKI